MFPFFWWFLVLKFLDLNRLLGQFFKSALTNCLAAYRLWKHNTDSTFKVDMTNLLPIKTSRSAFSSCSCFVAGMCIRMVCKSVLFTHYFGNYRLELSKLSSEHEPKCCSWPEKIKTTSWKMLKCSVELKGNVELHYSEDEQLLSHLNSHPLFLKKKCF